MKNKNYLETGNEDSNDTTQDRALKRDSENTKNWETKAITIALWPLNSRDYRTGGGGVK